ncbi:hydrogenase expression protein HypF [Streptomyces capparidis]
MPTAVLMGMGLTPRLAQADEVSKDKFTAGPCVTAPDKAGEEEKEPEQDKAPDKASDKASDKDAKDAGKESGKDTGKAGEDAKPPADGQPVKPAPSETASTLPAGSDKEPDKGEEDQQDGGEGSGGTGGADEPAPKPEESGPSTEPVEQRPGLLDPILGPIGDLLNPDRDKDGEDTAQQPPAASDPSTPSTPSTPPAADEDKTPEDEAPQDEAPQDKAPQDKESQQKTGDTGAETDPVAGERDEVDAGSGAEDEAAEDGKTDDKPEDDKAADGKTDDKPADEAAEGTDPADGPAGYPCPEEKKVPGTDEVTDNALPNTSWVLESTRLDLHGLAYHGVVNVTRQNGQTVQALKFTASGLDIGNLHQIVNGENGYDYHVQARDGSTSSFENGTVTMYTERLKGKLLGIIPIEFDAEHEPPLVLPELFFTDVTVTQVAQYGGTLNIPGMRVYTTPQ